LLQQEGGNKKAGEAKEKIQSVPIFFKGKKEASGFHFMATNRALVKKD